MPAVSLYTAEFVQKIDDLFDSLNSSCLKPRSNKKYVCALSENSPHFILWNSMLEELSQWRLIDKRNNETSHSNIYLLMNVLPLSNP